MGKTYRFRINLKAVALIVIVLFMLFGVKFIEINRLRETEAALLRELHDMESAIRVNEERLNYVASDAFVEREARIKLNMVYPGERIFRVQV